MENQTDTRPNRLAENMGEEAYWHIFHMLDRQVEFTGEESGRIAVMVGELVKKEVDR